MNTLNCPLVEQIVVIKKRYKILLIFNNTNYTN